MLRGSNAMQVTSPSPPITLQMVKVVSILADLVNVRRVNFFPHTIVVELVVGDGRVYARGSLPGIVAGLATTYHHASISFFDLVRSHLLGTRSTYQAGCDEQMYSRI